jgi:Na+/H+-translocating membrane pyrophosphatase
VTQPPYHPYHPNHPNQPPSTPGPPGQPGVPYVPPEHPQATTVLVLGILGLALCQLIAPVAWFMGSRARREIAESRGRLGGGTQVTIGWALGLAGTLLMIALVAFFVLYFVFIIGLFAVTGVESSST